MSGVATLQLTLPLPENIANARLHWRTKNRMRQDYFAACDRLQLLKLVPPPPRTPMTRARIHAVAYVGGRMDFGNLTHRVEKWPCDWLKTRGYIVDDSEDVLDWTKPRQVVKRGQEYRIEITLDNLASAH